MDTGESSCISVSSQLEDVVPADSSCSSDGRREHVRRLWIKRDADYRLDMAHEDMIWNRFVFRVNMLRENKKYERDIREDAFYSSFRSVPVADVEMLGGCRYLLERMSCERLREMSLRLVDHAAALNREAEAFIVADFEGLPDDAGLAVGTSIVRKRRILGLVENVRNYIGEIVMMGERCHRYIGDAGAIVSKNILEMDRLFN